MKNQETKSKQDVINGIVKILKGKSVKEAKDLLYIVQKEIECQSKVEPIVS